MVQAMIILLIIEYESYCLDNVNWICTNTISQMHTPVQVVHSLAHFTSIYTGHTQLSAVDLSEFILDIVRTSLPVLVYVMLDRTNRLH